MKKLILFVVLLFSLTISAQEKKQQTVKTGDKVLISEQLLQDITIRDQGKLEDVFKINSADSIFAYVKT